MKKILEWAFEKELKLSFRNSLFGQTKYQVLVGKITIGNMDYQSSKPLLEISLDCYNFCFLEIVQELYRVIEEKEIPIKDVREELTRQGIDVSNAVKKVQAALEREKPCQ